MNKSFLDLNFLARPKDILEAIIGLAVGYGIASFLYFFKDHTVVALLIFCISTGIAICALFIPPAHEAIQKFFWRLGNLVGRILTYILLFPLFYLFFVPASFLRNLRGKDPLQLKHDSNKQTYWESRDKEELHQYRRQF